MVIRAIAGEVTVGITQTGDLSGTLGALRVVHYIRDAKTQQVDIEAYPFVHVYEIKAEVAEAANFKRLVEKNSTHVEFLRWQTTGSASARNERGNEFSCGCHGRAAFSVRTMRAATSSAKTTQGRSM